MALELFGDFNFIGGFDTGANPYQDQQVCINWYPEVAQNQSPKEPVSLLSAPGLVQVAAAPGGGAPGFSNTTTQWPKPYTGPSLPVRAMWVLGGRSQALVVIGSTLYLATATVQGSQTVPSSLTLTSIGTLQTSAGPVCIRDNGFVGTAIIVDGQYGYFYNIANKTLTQITDPAFLGANTVAFIDGWWILNQPNSQTFYTNSPVYSNTFNGTYFANKDSFSDKLVTVIELKEELWLIGEQTTEIWYDAGGVNFAFSRLVGSMLQVGTKAQGSVCRIVSSGKEGLIWLARSDRGENFVVKTNGFTFEVVSTPAVSNAFSQYAVTSDAVAYTYEDGGHSFYVLTFPTADVTWCYDASVPAELAWTQRLSYDPYAQSYHRHRGNCYMNFAGMRIVGDYQNGALYQLTRAAYTDAGWPILARRRSPYVWDKSNRARFTMSMLQLEFAPGQAPASGLGSTPHANLSISRDYGTTYGPTMQAPMGNIGQYTNRCIFRRLGLSRGTVFNLEVIDPVNRDMVGVTLRAEGP